MMWKTLKKLVNTKNQCDYSCVRFYCDDHMILVRDTVEIANRFNNYFIESIGSIVSDIDYNDSCQFKNSNMYPNLSEFSRVDMSQLRKIVNSLDNKFNVNDCTNSRILKRIFQTIGHVILNFINTSLSGACVPNFIKISTIFPIPKVANTIECSEFRPINTLPVVEKILEMVVYRQLLQHVEKYEILLPYQSGFRQNHSCESALQLTLSKFYADISTNKYIVCVFLDLKRAFETIDRSILLRKLFQYGFQGKVHEWLANYLSSRKQRVRIGDIVSEEAVSECGVPQGSVIGPLLFTLYINDIDLFVGCDFVNLFADDTLLVESDCNLDVAIAKMNKTLAKVEQYLASNRLKLNVSKTKGMIVTTKYKYKFLDLDKIDLHICNCRIDIVRIYKYLGLTIDCLLSFDEHFNYMQKKISKKLFFLSRVGKFLSMETTIRVYKTIIQPHFEYCASIVFQFNLNKMSCLQKLQNRAMRIILKCTRLTPIRTMLIALQWLNIADRVLYLTMVFIYKIINNLMPPYLTKMIVRAHDVHQYETRNAGDIFVNRTYATASKSLFFKGFIKYNSLPLHVRSAKSLRCFKSQLLVYITGTG